MLSFALYLIGSMVCIAGLAWIATLLGAAPGYVMIAAGLFLAVAIVFAVAQKRILEPPSA